VVIFYIYKELHDLQITIAVTNNYLIPYNKPEGRACNFLFYRKGTNFRILRPVAIDS
jgi:hypothetical protein